MFKSGLRRSIVILLAVVFLAVGCGSEDEAGAADDAATDEGAENDLETTESAPVESDSADSELNADADSDPDSDSNPGSDLNSEVDLEAAEQSAQEFSQCVRDRGIDVPDLTIGADGQLDLGNLIATVDPADPAVQQAILACQGSLNGGLAGSLNQILESQTFADALISFSQCVRDGGYDVADLTFAAVVSATLESGVGSSAGEDSVTPILASAMGLDPQDPAVAETIDGCVVLIRDGLGDLGLGG